MKLLVFVLIASFLLFAKAEVPLLDDYSLSQCGINCLYLCLKYHKIDEKLDDVYAAIKADEENNVSLKQLADFAKIKGLYVHPVIKPTLEDVEKFLTKDNSIILQYKIYLQDKSKLNHIAALVKPKQKMFLLDYPKPAKEIDTARLAMIVSNSGGMLVLSHKPVMNLTELFNSRSLRSLSFYTICAGFIIAGLFFINFKKFKKNKI